MSRCKHKPDFNTELLKKEPEHGRATYWFKCQHCDMSVIKVFEGGKVKAEDWKANKRLLAKWRKMNEPAPVAKTRAGQVLMNI